MKNLLITGGAGLIGSNFTRYALDKYDDYRTVVFDKLTYAGNLDNLKDLEENPRFAFVQGDICDATAVDQVMQELAGRVTNNNAAGLSAHATHVAGTMIAAGVFPAAKGMSFNASIRGWDFNNDIAEMIDEQAAERASLVVVGFGLLAQQPQAASSLQHLEDRVGARVGPAVHARADRDLHGSIVALDQ